MDKELPVKTVWKRLCSLIAAAVIACTGTAGVLAAESHTTEPEEESAVSEAADSIVVSVRMTEPEARLTLIPNLTLSCPAGTTAVGVLELLRKYAYLSDFFLDDGALVRVEIADDGEIQYYGRDGSWELLLNGQSVPDGDSPVLQNGDSLEWIYTADTPNSSLDIPEWEIAKIPSTALWSEAYADRLAAACSWLKQNLTTSRALVGLGAAGVSVEYRDIAALLERIASSGSYQTAREAAEDILAVTFCGIPATNAAGKDLIQTLSDYPDISRGGTLSAVMALLAADSNQYLLPSDGVNTRATLRTVLLSSQNEDGGFAAERDGESCPLCTAAALTALSAYVSDEHVRSAVDAGLAYLSANQLADGSFAAADGEPSATATSAVLIALCALGVDPDSEDFRKNGSLLDALFSFQVESGGFSPAAGESAGEEATTAAILALSAVKSARNIFILRTPLSITYAADDAVSSPAADSSQSAGATEEVSGRRILFGGAWMAAGLLLGMVLLAVILLLVQRQRKRRFNKPKH